MAKKLKLRPYQVGAVQNIIRALNDSGRALLVAPTGAGKTEMLCGIIRELPTHARVLVVQHLLDLVAQNAARINRYELGRGVVTFAGTLPKKFGLKGDGSKAGVVVGTVQTLQGLLDYLGRFDVLVIDEAHHSEASSYRVIVDTLRQRNPALAVVGLTATPERNDHKGLSWLFGDRPAANITLVELVNAGWLVPPRVMAVPLSKLRDLKRLQLGSLDDGGLNVEVVHDEVIRTWRAHAADRQTVMFCADVAHAEGLAAAFVRAGVEAACVSYETPAAKRAQMLRDFADGKGVKVMTNALLLTEGFDAPATSCIGLIRPFGSKSLLIQGVGRGLRLAPGKTDCLVLDYVAAAERHTDLIAGTELKGRKKKSGIERGSGERSDAAYVLVGEGQADLQEYDAIGVKVNFVAQELEAVEPAKPVVINGQEVISRAEAVARGLSYYFTGVPCSKGHFAKRFTSQRVCSECQRAGDKKPERREYMRTWAKKPDNRECARERNRAWRQKPENCERDRARTRERSRAWRQKPENCERERERKRARRQQKKQQLETQT